MVNKEIKEKKSGFNIVDLLIVLFVILAAAGIVMRYNLADEIQFNALGETFEIEFKIGPIQEASRKYLKPGEKFYINIEGLEIGTIKEILDITDPAVDYDTVINGTVIRTELPGRIEVTGVMTSKGRTTRDGDIYLNGNSFIAAGGEFLANTGKLEVTVRILSVKKVG